MKKILLTLLFLYSVLGSAQQGKIYPKNKKIKHGEVNTYIYEPPVGLEIPEDAWAVGQSNTLNLVSCPLVKMNDKYEFKMKFAIKDELVLITIQNNKERKIDTNNDNPYTIILNSKLTKEKLREYEIFIWNFTLQHLDPKVLTEKRHNAFFDLFKKYPHLKNEFVYTDFLCSRYMNNPEETKDEIIQQIEIYKKKESEEDLNSLAIFYSLLGMMERTEEINLLTLKKYPKGLKAKYEFFQNFNLIPNKTEQIILDKEKEYKSIFTDYTEDDLFGFKYQLLQLYLKEKNLEKIKEIENDPVYGKNLGNSYNNHAWQLSGQDLTSPGTDLDFAERLSKKSLEMVKYQIENPDYSSYTINLYGTYNAFADTYALILYKQKKYQEAFDYQYSIAEQDELDTGGKERYAAYAEKAKGMQFTKNYIEKELGRGTNSKLLTEQLERIYQELNLPKEALETKKQQLKKIVTENAKKEVINLYGDVKAPDFDLENLEGKKVKLSDYKGKLIVLDFWATWCRPCRASFPKMQALVNEYESVKVVFLFIDTEERNSKEKIKNKVTEFLKEHEYTFNVLYDFNSEVANKYKIKGIPTKVLIDKEGNIISVNSSEENIEALIEENK